MGFDGQFFAHTARFLEKHLAETRNKRLLERILMHNAELWPYTDAIYKRNFFRRHALARVQTLLIDGTNVLFKLAETRLRVDEDRARNVHRVALEFKKHVRRLVRARDGLLVVVVAFDHSAAVPYQKWAEWDQRDYDAYRAGYVPLASRKLVSYYGQPRLAEMMRTRSLRDEYTRRLVDELYRLYAEDVANERFLETVLVLDANDGGKRYLFYPASAGNLAHGGEWDPADAPPVASYGEGDIALLELYRFLKTKPTLTPHMQAVEWYVNDTDFLAVVLSMLSDDDARLFEGTAPPDANYLHVEYGMHLVHLTQNRTPPSPLVDVFLWFAELIRLKYARSLFELLYVAYLSGTDYVHSRPPFIAYARLHAIAQKTAVPATEQTAADYAVSLYTALKAFEALQKDKRTAVESIARPSIEESDDAWHRYALKINHTFWRCASADEFENKARVTATQALWQWHYFRRNTPMYTAPELTGAWRVENYRRVLYSIEHIGASVPPPVPAARAPRSPPPHPRMLRHTRHVFRLTSVLNTSPDVLFNIDGVRAVLAPYLEPVKLVTSGEWMARWTDAYYPDFAEDAERGWTRDTVLVVAYRAVVQAMARFGVFEFDWRASNEPYVFIEPNNGFYRGRVSNLWTNEQRLWYVLWDTSNDAHVHTRLIEQRLKNESPQAALDAFFFLRNKDSFLLKESASRTLDDPASQRSLYARGGRTIPPLPGVEYVYASTDNVETDAPSAVVFTGKQWTRASAGRVVLAFFFDRRVDAMRRHGKRMAHRDLCYLNEVDPARDTRPKDWEGDELLLLHYDPDMSIADVLAECDLVRALQRIDLRAPLAQMPPSPVSPQTPPTPPQRVTLALMDAASDLTADELRLRSSSAALTPYAFDATQAHAIAIAEEELREQAIIEEGRQRRREADEAVREARREMRNSRAYLRAVNQLTSDGAGMEGRVGEAQERAFFAKFIKNKRRADGRAEDDSSSDVDDGDGDAKKLDSDNEAESDNDTIEDKMEQYDKAMKEILSIHEWVEYVAERKIRQTSYRDDIEALREKLTGLNEDDDSSLIVADDDLGALEPTAVIESEDESLVDSEGIVFDDSDPDDDPDAASFDTENEELDADSDVTIDSDFEAVSTDEEGASDDDSDKEDEDEDIVLFDIDDDGAPSLSTPSATKKKKKQAPPTPAVKNSSDLDARNIVHESRRLKRKETVGAFQALSNLTRIYSGNRRALPRSYNEETTFIPGTNITVARGREIHAQSKQLLITGGTGDITIADAQEVAGALERMTAMNTLSEEGRLRQELETARNARVLEKIRREGEGLAAVPSPENELLRLEEPPP